MPEKPNILIAVPAYGGSVKNDCMMSLIRLVIEFAKIGVSFTVNAANIGGIHLARNVFASFTVQDEQFTHIGFVDSDMTYAPSAFTRMIEADKDVIGCIYPRRQLDLNAALDNARHTNNATAIARASRFAGVGSAIAASSDAIVAIEGIGAGMMLIKRTALLKMIATGQIRTQAQHFYKSAGLTGPIYGFFDAVFDGPNEISEDFSFCLRYRKLCSGQVFAITDEDIGHIGEFTYRAKLSDKQ